MRILQISDVRIGRSQTTERYRHVFGELKHFLEVVTCDNTSIDTVVILGLIEYHGRLTKIDFELCNEFISMLGQFTQDIILVPGHTDADIIGKIKGVRVEQSGGSIHGTVLHYGELQSVTEGTTYMCGGLQKYTVRDHAQGSAVYSGQFIQHSFTKSGTYGCVLWTDNEHKFIPLAQLVAPEQLLLRNISSCLGKPIPDTAQMQEEMLATLPSDNSDLITLHREFSPKPVSKWYITGIQFNNLFRYGSGNYISLDNVNGIIGILGRNAMGKSSLLDIIIFGLFGKSIRGSRDTRINIGAGESSLSIKFIADDTTYVVERIDTSTQCKKCVLSNAIATTTVASGHDVYSHIEGIIGSYEEFLYTAMCYSGYNIIMASQVDCERLLGATLGVGDKVQTLRVVKQRIKALETALGKIPRGDPGAAEELAGARIELDKLHKFRAEVQLRVPAGANSIGEIIRLQGEVEKHQGVIDRVSPHVFEVIVDAPFASGDKSLLDAEADAADGLPPVSVLEYERGLAIAGGDLKFNPECGACKSNKNILSVRRVTEIDRDIEIAKRAEIAKKTLRAIYFYEQSVLCKKLQSAKESLMCAKERIDYLSQGLNTSAEELYTLISSVDKKIGVCEYNISRYQVLADQHAEYMRAGAPMLAQLETLQRYKKCISGGFYQRVVAKIMGVIIDKANAILEHCAGIKIGYDGRFLLQGTRSLPVELGSGYQQFIIGLVLRAVLSRGGFMIIDEGFVSADSINAERLHLLFAILKDMFKYVIVVSHLPQVQCNNDIVVEIKDVAGRSQIQYGSGATPSDNKVKCACGKVINRTSMYSHLRSKKHNTSIG